MASSAKIVDFSNVKEAGNFQPRRVPSGDYLATVTKAEDAESKKDKEFQYLFTIKLKKYSQNTYPFYCKLAENQLWKLRNLAIAAGLAVPKKKVKFDPNKVVGKTIGVTMEDDEYDGKEKSVIAAVFPSAELMEGTLEEPEDDEAEEDEDEADVDDDEDEEEGDELDGLDRAALKARLRQVIPGAEVKKSESDDDLRSRIRAADEDEDEDEDEEEEEEPPPPPKKKKKAKKPTQVTDDELEELDIDDI